MSRTYFDRGDFTLREVAELTGLSTRTMVRRTSKPRSEYLNEVRQRHNKIHELYEQGKSKKEIAHILGCSLATVYNALSEKIS